MDTQARKDGTDYVIDGAKMWISFLDVASFYLTFAHLGVDERTGRKRICAFLIDADAKGVSVHPLKNKYGFRPLATGELVLDNVRVPQEALLGEEGKGFEIAMNAVENGRLGVASRAVGLAQACVTPSRWGACRCRGGARDVCSDRVDGCREAVVEQGRDAPVRVVAEGQFLGIGEAREDLLPRRVDTEEQESPHAEPVLRLRLRALGALLELLAKQSLAAGAHRPCQLSDHRTEQVCGPCEQTEDGTSFEYQYLGGVERDDAGRARAAVEQRHLPV